MTHAFSRRHVLQGTGAGALALFMGGAASAVPARAAQGSQRAVYHMTPPSGWLSDPQRPVFLDGK